MSNEIKCPVCGGNMRIAYYAENMECKNCGLEIPSIVIKGFQSRIDTAVKEAVEKERVNFYTMLKTEYNKVDKPQNKRISMTDNFKDAERRAVKRFLKNFIKTEETPNER